jgi:hypothetical protein
LPCTRDEALSHWKACAWLRIPCRICELLQQLQKPVTIIDADPNHPFERWLKLKHKPELLNFIFDDSDDTILDNIEKAKRESGAVRPLPEKETSHDNSKHNGGGEGEALMPVRLAAPQSNQK